MHGNLRCDFRENVANKRTGRHDTVSHVEVDVYKNLAIANRSRVSSSMLTRDKNQSFSVMQQTRHGCKSVKELGTFKRNL